MLFRYLRTRRAFRPRAVGTKRGPEATDSGRGGRTLAQGIRTLGLERNSP